MARWKLTTPHYLNVPGTEWEYKETDRSTGKQGRKVFEVPLLLHPDDPTQQNRDGEVIVCYEGKGSARDHVFVGPPTPDMEPLDDEAQAISDRERHKWRHPIEGEFTGDGGYARGMLADFEKQIADLQAGIAAKPAAPVSAGGVSAEDFAKLQEQVASLMAANAELSSQLKRSGGRHGF